MGNGVVRGSAHFFDEGAYPHNTLQLVNLLRQELQHPQYSPPEFSPMVFLGTNMSPGRSSTTGWIAYLAGSRVSVRMKSPDDTSLCMPWNEQARQSTKPSEVKR